MGKAPWNASVSASSAAATSAAPTSPPRGSSRSSTSARSPTSIRPRPRAAGRSSGSRRPASPRSSPTPAIEIVRQPHDPRRPCRGRPRRRSRPASTSTPRSRSASPSPRPRALVAEADRRGLRVGCAPDTFLGGAHQAARGAHRRRAPSASRSAARPSSCARATSAGIPTPTSTTRPAAGRCSTWAPTTSPTSSTCSGPVARVAAMAPTPAPRRARSPASRAHGETIPVEVPTHVAGTLAFASGAVVQVAMSFDVAGAPPPAAGDLRHRGQRSSCPTRTGSAARSSFLPGRRVAGGAGRPLP